MACRRRLGFRALFIASSIPALMQIAACADSADPADPSSSLVPDADAPPVSAEPGTPLHHAQTCSQYLGPIPAMSCADAQLMPITVDGVEVFETPADCDRPSALTGTCETGQRIAARYQGTHHDGSARPEVVFMNFCRDGGMGVIGHNSETGATCFFHINMAFPNDAQYPGSNDPGYDDYWQTADVVAAETRPCRWCRSRPRKTRPTSSRGKASPSPNMRALPRTRAPTATAPSATRTSPFRLESW
jgi:hypothetical protein